MELNQQQQQAVDTIEGPVMVIAGAGTGKTQVIAHRIANILQKTQTSPSSILCLTFTDNAATNMRTRLISLIGPTAYSVRIHTFHSFCQEIIQSHPDYFIFAPKLIAIEELDKIQIIRGLLDKLPDNSTIRPWGDHYFYQRDIISAIQTLKRENISVDKLSTLISDQEKFISLITDHYSLLKSLRVNVDLDNQITSISQKLLNLPNISSSILSLITYHSSLYKNGGYNLGAAKNPAINYKNALLKFIDNLIRDIPKQKDLQTIYLGYQSALQTNGYYDFDDMILFVIRAFEAHPDLLLEHQEQSQYFLVDEYQDTNSAQNKIINQLASYYDQPNLFVVGDDDQSIFRFQGASTANILDFYNQYHPTVIVLQNNYRSHQLILDSASSVIRRNQNQLVNYIKNIDKSLVSALTLDTDPINIITPQTTIEENYFISIKIRQLLDQGTPPSEIAILFRNNSDIADLVEHLSVAKIKYFLSSDQNILDLPLIRQMIYLLTLIDDQSRKDLVYHLLCAPFINLNSNDINTLLLGRDLLNYKAKGISQTSKIKIKNLILRLNLARKWVVNLPLDRFFDKIIRKFKILKSVLATHDPHLLNALNTFYQHLRHQFDLSDLTLHQFVLYLQSLSDNNLPLVAPQLPEDSANSIQLLTVHRAKGLEFSHVFLYKVVDKKWGNSVDRNHLHLPLGIINTSVSSELDDQNEEERRLFYVALTRAKSQIYISYSQQNQNGRPQLPSQFISEIDPQLIQPVLLPDNLYQNSLSSLFSDKNIFHRQDHAFTNYLKTFLTTDYIFNVTHLNSYLRCPLCFYYQTILRLPAVRDKFSSFGTAIHEALSFAYTISSSQPDIKNIFEKSLKHQHLSQNDFNESLARGFQTLVEYVDFYRVKPSKNYQVDYDFKKEHQYLDNIPLTGKIDLIEKIGDKLNLYDFKTGNPDSKSTELGPDGEYFRQIAFYHLLISSSSRLPHQIISSYIDFVQKSKTKDTFIRKEITITPEDIQKLEVQIREVYQKILALEFNNIGSGCQDKHHLHYLFGNSVSEKY
ncbi:MAG: ATP-dependent DNA helicase [Microgenomates group bacterium]